MDYEMVSGIIFRIANPWHMFMGSVFVAFLFLYDCRLHRRDRHSTRRIWIGSLRVKMANWVAFAAAWLIFATMTDSPLTFRRSLLRLATFFLIWGEIAYHGGTIRILASNIWEKIDGRD